MVRKKKSADGLEKLTVLLLHRESPSSPPPVPVSLTFTLKTHFRHFWLPNWWGRAPSKQFSELSLDTLSLEIEHQIPQIKGSVPKDFAHPTSDGSQRW